MQSIRPSFAARTVARSLLVAAALGQIVLAAPATEPANGSLLVDRGSKSGLGSLTVQNRMERSATVKLLNTARQPPLVYEIFVQKGKEGTIAAIDPGAYELWYSFGSDWDAKEKKFTRDRKAKKANKVWTFTDTRGADSIKYVQATVILYTVNREKQVTTDKKVEEFDRLQ